MSKPVKTMLTDYLRKRYGDVDSACVVDLTGLDVATTQKLRGTLRAKGARMEVVKNRLARQAFLETALQPLGESLKGPCALVTGDVSIVDVAKSLVDFAKQHKQLKLKNAILEGDVDLLSVAELSKTKGRREFAGEIAALIWGPARRLAGAIASPQSRIAGCVKAIGDRQ